MSGASVGLIQPRLLASECVIPQVRLFLQSSTVSLGHKVVLAVTTYTVGLSERYLPVLWVQISGL